MNFAFLIMGAYYTPEDRAIIHDGRARIIGVNNIEDACVEAKKLATEGIGCIELCGAFGENGAKQIMEATENKVLIGYVVHPQEQDDAYAEAFPALFKK